MPGTTYRFTHTCEVPTNRERVQALLVDLEHYASWWPQVRAVAKVDDDHALVVCRSVLPYDLELHLTAVHRSEELLEVGIDGPISGFARWRLEPEAGPTVSSGPGSSSSRRCGPRPVCSCWGRTSLGPSWRGTTPG